MSSREKETLEKEVESRLVELVETVLAGECVKFIPDYKRGWPDRLLVLPGGRQIWVETKTVGGRVSAAQRIAHAQLRRLGHRVELVWTKEQADDLVAGLQASASK